MSYLSAGRLWYWRGTSIPHSRIFGDRCPVARSYLAGFYIRGLVSTAVSSARSWAPGPSSPCRRAIKNLQAQVICRVTCYAFWDGSVFILALSLLLMIHVTRSKAEAEALHYRPSSILPVPHRQLYAGDIPLQVAVGAVRDNLAPILRASSLSLRWHVRTSNDTIGTTRLSDISRWHKERSHSLRLRAGGDAYL